LTLRLMWFADVTEGDVLRNPTGQHLSRIIPWEALQICARGMHSCIFNVKLAQRDHAPLARLRGGSWREGNGYGEFHYHGWHHRHTRSD